MLLQQHLEALNWQQMRETNCALNLSGLGKTFQPVLRKHLSQVWDMATKSDMRLVISRVLPNGRILFEFAGTAAFSDGNLLTCICRYTGTTVQGDINGPTAVDNFLTNALLLAAKRDKYVYQQLLAVAHLSKPANQLLSDPYIIMSMIGTS